MMSSLFFTKKLALLDALFDLKFNPNDCFTIQRKKGNDKFFSTCNSSQQNKE